MLISIETAGIIGIVWNSRNRSIAMATGNMIPELEHLRKLNASDPVHSKRQMMHDQEVHVGSFPALGRSFLKRATSNNEHVCVGLEHALHALHVMHASFGGKHSTHQVLLF